MPSALENIAGGGLTSGNIGIGHYAGSGITTGGGYTVVGQYAGNSATYTGSNITLIGYDAEASSATATNEITLGDANVTALRIPGLQSGASDGDVLTFSSGTGKITLQAAGGGGASSLNSLSDVLIDGTSSYFINIPSGLSGNPAGNLVIGNSAGNSLTTGLGNIAIGNQALSSGTIAQQNVAIGNECLPLVTGNSNVAVGYFAGKLSTSASNNTFIGNTAGQQNSQGDGNTFVGKAAGFWNTTLGDNTYIGMNSGSVLGQKNVSSGVRSLAGTFAAVSESVAIGYEAGTNSQAGQVTFVGSEAGRANTAVGSISVGYQSGYTQTSGARNTNIGYQAGYSVSTSSSNTHIGYQAGRYHNTPGNVLIGEYAGSSAAWALVGGTVVGQNAGLRLQYGDGITAIGRYAAQGVTGTQGARQGCTFVGEYSGSYANSNFNTVVGSFALYGVNNVSNPNKTVAVGYEAAYAVTTGDQNTAVGYQAGKTITTGNNITVIGHQAEPSSATATNEITLGDANITALRIPGLQSGASDGDVLTFASGTGLITLQAAGGGGASSLNSLSDVLIDTASEYVGTIPAGLSGNPQGNTTLGISAGLDLTTGTQNTLIGNLAGENITTQFGNTALGYQAGSTQNAESFNTYIGNQAGRDHIGAQSVFVGSATRVFSAGQNANGVTAVGYGAGDSKVGNFSTAIGYSAGGEASGQETVYVGRDAGKVNLSTGHISIGYQSGFSQTSGLGNVNIGYKAGYSNTTGQNRTMLGYEAGLNNTGNNNVFLGKATGRGSGSGSQTIAIGQGVMEGGSAANNSVFIGNFMAYDTTSGANSTVAIGTNCLSVSGYSAEGNTVVGYLAGNNLTSGDNNVLLGKNAGDGITTSHSITSVFT